MFSRQHKTSWMNAHTINFRKGQVTFLFRYVECLLEFIISASQNTKEFNEAIQNSLNK